MRNRPLTILLLAGAIASAGAVLAPVVAGAARGATVTAVVGSAKLGGSQALEHLAGVAEDEPVATSQDGGCSLLLEENAVVELCGDTRLSLRRPAPGGPRVLEIERGRVRISAEKRLGDERIEIHTPAVIATILGTVVFVSVDVLGVTTITSEVSKVMVASSNPALSQATVLEGGEQLVVSPGEPPPVAPKRLDATALSELGGCLVDFHDASLQADRKEMLRREAEMISEADAMTADLPVVGLVEPPADQTPDSPGELGDPTGGPDVYPPTSVNPLAGPPDDGYPEPCQDGFPGDHCGPLLSFLCPFSQHAREHEVRPQERPAYAEALLALDLGELRAAQGLRTAERVGGRAGRGERAVEGRHQPAGRHVVAPPQAGDEGARAGGAEAPAQPLDLLAAQPQAGSGVAGGERDQARRAQVERCDLVGGEDAALPLGVDAGRPVRAGQHDAREQQRIGRDRLVAVAPARIARAPRAAALVAGKVSMGREVDELGPRAQLLDQPGLAGLRADQPPRGRELRADLVELLPGGRELLEGRKLTWSGVG